MLTSSVICSRKLLKFLFKYFLKYLINFNEIFRIKRPGLHPLSTTFIFGKTAKGMGCGHWNFINSHQTNISWKMNGFLKILFSHFWFFHYSKINLTFVKRLFWNSNARPIFLRFCIKCTSSYCSVENWISIFRCIKDFEMVFQHVFNFKMNLSRTVWKTSIVKDKFLNIISVSVVK